MKRVLILSHTNTPGVDGPVTLYKDSVLDVDDNIAGQLIAAGRAKQVDDDVKVKSTERAYLAEADRAAAAAALPNDAVSALVEKRVAEALAAAGVKPTEQTAQG